jgi:hypothetical protein
MSHIFAALIGGLSNLWRGGRFGADSWPGHPRYWIAAAGFLGLWGVSSLATAAIVVGGVLLWATPAWGRWYTLGRLPRSASGDPSIIEKYVERIGGESDHLCFGIRMGFAAPTFIGAWALTGSLLALASALIFPPLAVLLMEIAWRYGPPESAIMRGEGYIGAALGLALSLAFLTNV